MTLQELLCDITIHYNSFVRSAASQLNVTASQAFLLISIPHDGVPMSKLAHKLGLDASTLTRNIQKLETIGFVERKPSAYDRRVQRAFLTKDGVKLTSKIEDLLLQMNALVVEQIDLDCQANMCDVLEKLLWSMDCVREK